MHWERGAVARQKELGCPCSWNPGDGYGMAWNEECDKCLAEDIKPDPHEESIDDQDIEDMLNDAPGG
jgi:hypothetical protein